MDKFELQQLRDLPIEGVAERLGLRVVRHKCLCPFHDDHHASLSFKNNKFKCWSCGESGDSISLVMKLLPVRGGREGSFLEACRWLADGSLTPIPSPQERGEKNSSPKWGGWEGARFERFFSHPWLSPEARRFLFEERKLDKRVVRWCRLTSWRDKQGVNWLQIPYYNMEGKLIGLQNRNLSSPPYGGARGGLLPRFRFPQGSECSIYNLPILNLLNPGEDLYITEGCSDCWAILSAGHKALAIPSATLLKPKDKELLRGLGSSPYGEAGRGPSINFHMYPDRDAPGERLFLQLKEILPGLEHHQLPQECKDYSEYYLKMKE